MSVSNLDIRAAFQGFLDDLDGLPVTGWGDRGFVPPADQPSLRLNLLPSSKTYAACGIDAREARGVFIAEVWTPVGMEAEADEIASRLEIDFLDAGEIGNVWIMDGTATEGRAADGLWRVQVRVGWRLIG